MDAVTNVPPPVNEPIRQYAPGSGERAVLEARVKELAGERAELTMTTGGQQRMGGGDRVEIVQPHNYRHVLGELGNVTEQTWRRRLSQPGRRRPAGASCPTTTGPRSS